MSFTFGYGMRRLLSAAPQVLNFDPVEDLGFELQALLGHREFRVQELFPGGAETLTGTSAEPFLYGWEEHDAAGFEGPPPPELAPHVSAILEGWGSGPNGFRALPGPTPDLLVPNVSPELAPPDASPRMRLLQSTTPFPGATPFVGREIQVGSLDALLDALKDTLAAAEELELDAEELPLGSELARQLELARRFDLCFSFCF